MGFIYCWTNIITKKKYIGQTTDPTHRMAVHKCYAFKRNSQYYFHRSLRKHGLENFTYEILAEIEDPVELSKKECQLIQEHNTIWPHGYNEILPTHAMSQEMRTKISESQKKRIALRTPEQKAVENAKKSQSLKGFKQSEHQKEVATNLFSKKWLVIHPDGKQEVVFNLRKFCKSHPANTGSMGSNISRKSGYKGYKATRLD